MKDSSRSNNNTGKDNNNNNNNSKKHDDQQQQCPSNASRAHGFLSTSQVERLRCVLDDDFEVHGRGNFPMLTVQLHTLIVTVRQHLELSNVTLRSIKLNGGCASHVIAKDQFPFSDLDLIFNVNLPTEAHFDRVRDAVLDSLFALLPDGTCRDKIDRSTLKDVYIRKMIKVGQSNCENGYDRWSLFALNNHYGRCIELKFVDKMRRQFEFSVDSFQLALEPMLDACGEERCHVLRRIASRSALGGGAITPASSTVTTTSSGTELSVDDTASWTDNSSTADSSLTTSSTSPPIICQHLLNLAVPAESVYGNFSLAQRHLNERLIDTLRPEEIRGGGLLKYCHLLVRGYRPAQNAKCRQFERYMCSRFFIDFPAIHSQEAKLIGYLKNHMADEDHTIEYEFLLLLHRIVAESTVCLMSHERRQTLAMIDRLAYELSVKKYYQQQCVNGVCAHTPRQTLLYLPRNASYWIPVV